MKKFIFLLVLLPYLGFSQSTHFDEKNAVKISPIEFGKAQFEMSYERYFGERTSSFSLFASVFLKDDIYESKEGYQFGGQYRAGSFNSIIFQYVTC